jgi:hypothetical protein
MQLMIRFSGGKQSDFGEHRFEDILTGTLARFRHRLKQAFLYIEDVNGPRGGIDKQCRCVLHLRRMPPVVIHDQDENMNNLIHRVANRAAYALGQRIGRSKKQGKRSRTARRHREPSGLQRPSSKEVAFLSIGLLSTAERTL